MTELLEQLQSLLLGLPPAGVYATIGILAAVENLFPPIPADTAVAVGAFLSAGGRISPVGIFAVTWASNVFSALAVFGAASKYGRPFFQGSLGARLMRPKYLERIDRLYGRYGELGIILSRFIPGVRAVVPLFAGLAHLSFPRVAIPLAIASGIWYGTITFVAATLVGEIHQLPTALQALNRGGLIIAGVAGVTIALVVYWRGRRRRRR